jgi:hypothetical protein
MNKKTLKAAAALRAYQIAEDNHSAALVALAFRTPGEVFAGGRSPERSAALGATYRAASAALKIARSAAQEEAAK